MTTPADLAALPYADFVAQTMAFFAALPPTDYSRALEAGYMVGWRSWDSQMCLRYGDFKNTDHVLDVGSWLTFWPLFLSRYVSIITASDNFYWAERDFARNVPPPQAWRDTIEELSSYLPHVTLWTDKVDLQAIQYPDDDLDKITCISTIEHVHDDALAMREMMRCLRPGGLLLLTTEYDPVRGKDYSETDGSFYRVYSEETFSALIAPYKVLHREISTLPHEHYFTVAFVAIEKE